jgi:hypothetical protein
MEPQVLDLANWFRVSRCWILHLYRQRVFRRLAKTSPPVARLVTVLVCAASLRSLVRKAGSRACDHSTKPGHALIDFFRSSVGEIQAHGVLT